MSDDRYAYWQHRLDYPDNSQMDDTLDPIDGWYRMHSTAKSKPDWPVVIWTDDAGTTWCQVGNAQYIREDEGPEWARFRDFGWYKCEAIEQKQYEAAKLSGTWPDGKPSRNGPATPDAKTEEQAKAGPVDEDYGNNRAPTFDVLDEEIAELVEQAKALPAVIADHPTAEKANDIYVRLRAAWKKADNERATEKEPHLTAGAAVDNRWRPLLERSKSTGSTVDTMVKDWLRKEDARLKAEEAERLAAAEATRKAEEARLAAEGEEPPEDYEPPQRKPAAPKAQLSSSFGTRATSLKTYKYGVIENETKFINAIKGRSDFKEFLKTTADALARAGAETKGMKIETGTR